MIMVKGTAIRTVSFYLLLVSPLGTQEQEEGTGWYPPTLVLINYLGFFILFLSNRQVCC